MKIQNQTVSEVKNNSRASTLAHETRKKRVKIITMLSAVAVMVIIAGFLAGCQKEQENEPLDEAILNSSEMEEYIIAGVDFIQSLAVYREKLTKIDLSQLEITQDAEGRKVMFLQEAVAPLTLKDEARIFEEKKEALLRKFPQFDSFSDEIKKYNKNIT